jgi:phospholipid/cholesterol/gamma-HCH transport system ATP-binding protein
MISVQHLTKRFNGVPALTGVSLEIRDNETFAVIGRSGSGKSVLLKHLVGLLRADSGRVLIDGIDLDQLSRRDVREVRRQFGILFQGGALFDSMSALENVAFPMRALALMKPAEAHRRAMRCLDMVELPHAAAKRPNELSGGQQKRVALARAIALNPRYILYDEPTSGLDPSTSATINDLIRQLGREIGATSIVISHDMKSVLTVADRAGYLHAGRLHWTGTIAEMHASRDEELLAFVRASEYTIGEYALQPA